MGFKIVRLGVLWEATETSEGVYDTTYLSQIEEIVNLLAENEI